MNYVYILQSVSDPERFYTGLCKDVEARLAAHNAG
ncbi:MAG TPA: GIY-YIG nuclease family protein [Allosphingosinicella sp.]|jgi:predicted GIY-YIG superfamily endonuclease